MVYGRIPPEHVPDVVKKGRMERVDTQRRAASLLLVEDSSVMAATLSALLHGEGFGVTSCGNGSAALEHIRSATYEIALVDFQMPGMNGAEVVRHLRETCPGLFLVGMSLDDRRRSAFLTAGADAFVDKRYLDRDLLQILGRRRKEGDVG
jgi:CheY-like chemotaxis protein